MGKINALVFCLLLFTGCNQVMITNDEIIKEKNKCVAGGMDYELWSRWFDGAPIRLQCVPFDTAEERMR